MKCKFAFFLLLSIHTFGWGQNQWDIQLTQSSFDCPNEQVCYQLEVQNTAGTDWTIGDQNYRLFFDGDYMTVVSVTSLLPNAFYGNANIDMNTKYVGLGQEADSPLDDIDDNLGFLDFSIVQTDKSDSTNATLLTNGIFTPVAEICVDIDPAVLTNLTGNTCLAFYHSQPTTAGTFTSQYTTITENNAPDGTITAIGVNYNDLNAADGNQACLGLLVPVCDITGATSVNANATGAVYTAPAGMATYQWSVTNGDATINGATNEQNVTIDFGTANATIELTVTNATGCEATCTVATQVAAVGTENQWDIQVTQSSFDCPNEQVCYQLEVQNTAGADWTIGDQNYRLFFDGDYMTVVSVTSLLPNAFYGNANIDMNTKYANSGQDANSPLDDIDDNLGFLDFSIVQTDKSDPVNATLLTNGSFTPVAEICVDIDPAVLTDLTGNTCLAFYHSQPTTAGTFTSQYTTITENNAPDGTITAIGVNYNDLNAADGNQACLGLLVPVCDITGATSVNANATGAVYTAPAGMATYQWSVTNGDATINGATNEQNVTIDFGTANATIELTITSTAGCEATCAVTTQVTTAPNENQWDIQLTQSSFDCPNEQVCYQLEVQNTAGTDWTIGDQNYRLFFDGDYMTVVSVTSLLPNAFYGNANIDMNTKYVGLGQEADSPLDDIDDNLGFLDFNIVQTDKSDPTNATLLTTGTFTPVAEICVDIDPAVLTDLTGNTCLAFYHSQPTTAGTFTSQYTTITENNAPDGTITAIGVNYNDLNAADGNQACLGLLVPVCDITGATSVNANATGAVYTAPAGMATYQWSVTNGDATINGATNEQNVTIDFGTANATIELTVTSTAGCEATCAVTTQVTTAPNENQWDIQVTQSSFDCPNEQVCYQLEVQNTAGTDWTIGDQNYRLFFDGDYMTVVSVTSLLPNAFYGNANIDMNTKYVGLGQEADSPLDDIDDNLGFLDFSIVQTDKSDPTNATLLTNGIFTPVAEICVDIDPAVLTDLTGNTCLAFYHSRPTTAGTFTSQYTTITENNAPDGTITAISVNYNDLNAADGNQACLGLLVPVCDITGATSVNANATGAVYTAPAGMATYQWSVTNGDATINGATNEQNVTIDFGTANATIELTVTSTAGCEATCAVTTQVTTAPNENQWDIQLTQSSFDCPNEQVCYQLEVQNTAGTDWTIGDQNYRLFFDGDYMTVVSVTSLLPNAFYGNANIDMNTKYVGLGQEADSPLDDIDDNLGFLDFSIVQTDKSDPTNATLLTTGTFTPVAEICVDIDPAVLTDLTGNTCLAFYHSRPTTAGTFTSQYTTITENNAPDGTITAISVNYNDLNAADGNQACLGLLVPVCDITGATSVNANATGAVYTAPAGMATYQWSVTNGDATINGATNEQNVTIDFGTANATIELTVTSTAGCEATCAVTTQVTTAPNENQWDIQLTQSSFDCPNEQVCYQLEVQNTAGTDWTIGDQNYRLFFDGDYMTVVSVTSLLPNAFYGNANIDMNTKYANSGQDANSPLDDIDDNLGFLDFSIVQTDKSDPVNATLLTNGSFTPVAEICVDIDPAVLTDLTGNTCLAFYHSRVATAGTFSNQYTTITENDVPSSTTIATGVNYNDLNAADGSDACLGLLVPVCDITGVTSVNTNTTGEIYTAPAGMATYQWAVTNGDATINGATNEQNVTIDFGTANATIELTVTNATGCEATCTVATQVTTAPNENQWDIQLTQSSFDCPNEQVCYQLEVQNTAGTDWTIGDQNYRLFFDGDYMTVVSVTSLLPNAFYGNANIDMNTKYANSGQDANSPLDDIDDNLGFLDFSIVQTDKSDPVNATLLTNGSFTPVAEICVDIDPAVLTDLTGNTCLAFYHSRVATAGTFSNQYTTITENDVPSSTTIATGVNYNDLNAADGSDACLGLLVPVCDITGVTSVNTNTTGEIYTAPAGMATYQWAVTNGDATINGATNEQNVTIDFGTANATIELTVTSTAGCEATCAYDITVSNVPCTFTGLMVVCNNTGGWKFTGTADADTYAWSIISGDAVIDGANNIQILSVDAGNTDFTIQLTITPGNTATCTQTVTVNSDPIISANGNDACEGDMVTLTGGFTSSGTSTGITTWSWTGPNGFSSTDQNPTPFAASATTTGTYTLTATDNNGCVNTDMVIIQTFTNPVCSVSGATLVVENSQDVVYTAPPAMMSYSWNVTNGDAAIDGAANGQNVTINFGTVNSTIELTITNGNGCTSTCTLNVIVSNSLYCDINGSTFACENTTGLIFSAPVGTANYAWSITSGDAIINGSNTEQTVSVDAGSNDFTLELSLTTGSTVTCSQAVTIYQTPNINLTVSDSIVCLFTDAVPILYTSEVGMTYQVKNDIDNSLVGSPVAGTGGNLSLLITDLNTVGTFTYTIIATDASGNCVVELTDKAVIIVRSCDYQDNLPGCNTPPCHFTSSDIYLGNGVSAEESTNGTPSADTDDDDGAKIPNDLSPGTTFYIPTTIYNVTGNPAFLSIWLDWNLDGTYDDVGEQIVSNTYDPTNPAYTGTFVERIPVNVPVDAMLDQDTPIRFRLSTDSVVTNSPCGEQVCAADGEVEDYSIQIQCSTVICLPVQVSINRAN